jgi:hypothetical protein
LEATRAGDPVPAVSFGLDRLLTQRFGGLRWLASRPVEPVDRASHVHALVRGGRFNHMRWAAAWCPRRPPISVVQASFRVIA